jgi:hypothetical protein
MRDQAVEFPEPHEVYPEERFEASLLELTRVCLADAGVRYAVVPKFGLDIAVFLQVGSARLAKFIEAKSYGAQRMGGVGFGSGKGVGPQVDLLLCAEDELAAFDPYVRWAIVDATRRPTEPRYGLFSCSRAKGAAMGCVARGKQNNLRLSSLASDLVEWSRFCDAFRKFLINGPPG